MERRYDSMLIKDIEVGKIVEFDNEKEVILGLFMDENSVVTYAYQPELFVYLVTYPYCEDMFQRSLNIQLVHYRHILSLQESFSVVNVYDLKVWITKSTLQNRDLKEFMASCKTDINKIISYLTKEHKIFLKYQGYCKDICSKHLINTTLQLGKCKTLKVGQVFRNYRNNTSLIVYLGKDLFFRTMLVNMLKVDFVLVSSALSYKNIVVDRMELNFEYWEDTGLNLCELPYNKEKIKEIVNVCIQK